MLSTIESVNNVVNNFIWGVPAMICIIGVGLLLSVRTGFIQIRKFPYAMKVTIGRMLRKKDATDGAMTPFQAVCTALAATVGTGNIAGVAGAIAIGGPGAVFWMWISALLGMCTKFSEVTLAVHFREKNAEGDLVGGPMYYIKNGLNKNWHWLAYLFAAFGVLTVFGTGNATQVNTITTAIDSALFNYGVIGVDVAKTVNLVIGIVLAYKANVLNIALEGMMLNGAFISVLVEYLTGSVALAVIAAIVTTLLWGLVFSFLGITCNGNVIVIGLGINLIVPAIAKFVLKVMELANISLQDVGVADFKINIPGIKSIPLIGGIVSGHPVITYLAFIGIAAAAILMYKTKFGIYVRVVGENEDSAISLGLKTQKYKYIAVLIGAFCCALAGINLSMERMAMFTSDMTAGRGFIAIAAIYCGQGKPVQSSLYAILFGVARSLAVNLSVYAGPAAGMFDTIPYIIMVAVLAVVSFMKFKDVKVRGYKFD